MILNMHLGLRTTSKPDVHGCFLYLFCARPCNDDLGMCEICSLSSKQFSKCICTEHVHKIPGRKRERKTLQAD